MPEKVAQVVDPERRIAERRMAVRVAAAGNDPDLAIADLRADVPKVGFNAAFVVRGHEGQHLCADLVELPARVVIASGFPLIDQIVGVDVERRGKTSSQFPIAGLRCQG